MVERNNNFDFDFTPIGQAIKKVRGSQRNDKGTAFWDNRFCSQTYSSNRK